MYLTQRCTKTYTNHICAQRCTLGANFAYTTLNSWEFQHWAKLVNTFSRVFLVVYLCPQTRASPGGLTNRWLRFLAQRLTANSS